MARMCLLRTAVAASTLVVGFALALTGCALSSLTPGNTATKTTAASMPAETSTTPPIQPTGNPTGTAAGALCMAADLAGCLDGTGGGAAS